MTKDEIIQIVAKRLNRNTDLGSATWNDLVSGVQAMTGAQRNELLVNIKSSQFDKVGIQLFNALKGQMRTDSVAEATAMLADDQLSLAELEKIL